MAMAPKAKESAHDNKEATSTSTTTACERTTEQEEEEYRSRCRRFYRQSTSVIDDNEDDSGSGSDHDTTTNKAITAAAAEENRLVLEAVDKLLASEQHHHHSTTGTSTSTDTDAYASFVRQLAPEQRDILLQCGLPTDTDTDTDQNAGASWTDKLERWIAIRTQERKMAHEVAMHDRRQILQRILKEEQHQLVREVADNDKDDPTKHSTSSRSIQRSHPHIQILREFVHTYVETSVASHSLLAGMRHAIERQLDDDDASCICWTLEAAVLTEAVVMTHQQGGSAQYMRDAVQALLSFLVLVVDEDDEKKSRPINNESETLTFAMNPTLSNKTLLRLLQELPRGDTLHARPTGRFEFAQEACEDHHPPTAAAYRRTNVDGELDVTDLDFCTALAEHLLHWKHQMKWFC